MADLQPNSRHCFACGLENPVGLKLRFFQVREGEVRSEYVPPDQFEGYPGVLHGGVAASMLDEAANRAHMGIDPPRFMYTARLDIRYRKNIPVGQKLVLVGKATGNRGRVAEAWAGIYDEGNTLLAEAKAVLMNVPEETLEGTDSDRLGWKVYPLDEASDT